MRSGINYARANNSCFWGIQETQSHSGFDLRAVLAGPRALLASGLCGALEGLELHAAKRELTEPEGKNEDGELAEANMLKDVDEPVTQKQRVTLERFDHTKAKIPPEHTDVTSRTPREAHLVLLQLGLLVLCFRFRGVLPCEVGKGKWEVGRGPLGLGDQKYVVLRTTQKMHDEERHLASSFTRSSRSCSAVAFIC